MWWKWQNRSPERLRVYSGKKDPQTHHIDQSWTLRDTLDVGPLGPTVRVAEIIDTEAEMLCYRY